MLINKAGKFRIVIAINVQNSMEVIQEDASGSLNLVNKLIAYDN